MTKKTILLISGLALLISSCTKSPSLEPVLELEDEPTKESTSRIHENPAAFQLYGSIDVGDAGAAEISAYDPKTQKLFVVNNTNGNNRIDVFDFSDPSSIQFMTSIGVSSYGGLVNSLDVSDGFLAAAIEANVKTNPGKVIILNTGNYSEVRQVTVGSLPDMIAYSPDGKLILTANEGEPNNDYSIDPVGTVSIISVKDNYAVTNLDFSSFASRQTSLQTLGLRKFGPGASFAQDMEPEYVTISKDSRTAWVTLQENNAIARIDLRNKIVMDLFPLGFKNYSQPWNAVDIRDGAGYLPGLWPAYGMYQPDGIAVFEDNKGLPYLFTANEGDAREYTGINPVTGNTFVENLRVSSSSVILDPFVFPNASTLKLTENMGRLNITKALGDENGDGDFDKLYSFGSRSFSVWNGNTGLQLFDSRNELDTRTVAAGFYDDSRSDDKSIEPEGIALGVVNKKLLAFIGMERANAVAIYDASNPGNPQFLQILPTGIGPEGVLFISAKDSPNKRSLLVVSSEVDGFIKVYMPGNF